MMDKRLVEHIKACKLSKRAYAKLLKKTKEILPNRPTTDKFVESFADQCYGKEPDRKLANRQAKVFLEAVYGNIDDLLAEGPYVAAYLTVFGRINFNHWPGRFKHYLVGYELGKGATSIVKIGLNLQSDKKVALKIMKPNPKKRKEANEFSILKKLNHTNIVKVYESFENTMFDDMRRTVIAIEFVEHGELIDYLMYTPKFNDELARWFFTSLVEGVEYCHSKNIIHRDLKHDNCLLSTNFTLKISDFGFATHYYGKTMKTAIGTAQYVAPEILEGKAYTDAVDIFSMGVMLFIAIAGTMPWRLAHHKKDRWYKWIHDHNWDEFFKFHRRRSHKFTEDQRTILEGILEPDPAKRWTLTDIQKCPWYLGKKNAQKDVARIMRRRKFAVDEKKYGEMEPKRRQQRRAVDIFTGKIPNVYFKPIPPLSFITDKKAEWALEDISNAITELEGNILTKVEDRLQYKLVFWVNKCVPTSRYKNKETKEILYDKVRVHASVQMWTLPGQQKALDDREKELAALSGPSSKKGLKASNNKNPKIKSVAVFRSEGSSEEKYLFPGIFSDILVRLPADIISKDFLYDDDVKEREFTAK